MSVLEAWAPGAPFPVYRLDQMMAKQQQVVIVGGGVIGLLTAYNLASAGQAVILLERAGLPATPEEIRRKDPEIHALLGL